MGLELTIGVDNRSDVEVVFVDEGLDGRVGGVLGQELVGHVLGSLQSLVICNRIVNYLILP